MATAPLGTLLRHIHKLAGEPPGSARRADRQLLDDFADRRSEEAFSALVDRHGPMVLRVCRRVLNHEQDAEDAFQATFLVLARNTRSIRKRDSIGDWLHGVAYRTAMKLKRSAARRRNHERKHWRAEQRKLPGCSTRQLTLLGSPSWDDVQAVLDEEIQRLPACFREAFVLCVLEGKSGSEAAAELRCKEGTVKSRVNRARQALQRRLSRRGIKLAALFAALSVAESAARAALPVALARTTIRFGLSVAAGQSAAGVIPTHIAALAVGVTRAMFVSKAKIAVVLMLFSGLLAACGFAFASAGEEKQQPANTRPQAADVPRAATEEAVTYSGRVLDPDGKGVVGAIVYLTKSWRYYQRPAEATANATTADDGTFRFSVPTSIVSKEHLEQLVVTAKGFGPAWSDYSAKPRREEVTFRLVKDLPITGQVVDLQGKPLPGVRVRVVSIKATVGEDLGPWFQDVKAKNGLSFQLEARHLKRGLPCGEFPSLPRQTATDKEGRFRIDGIGRERMANLWLEAPGMATAKLTVFTRRGEPVVVQHRNAEPKLGIPADTDTYRGASFRYVATPSKLIIGIVRDRDTKKPLAGVTIRRDDRELLPDLLIQTKTDVEGRYRFDGMPKGKGNRIIARPSDDQPYLMVHADVPDTAGLEPVTVDFDLKRGVWIEGKITDKANGKPVHGQVEYFASRGNRSIEEHPGYAGTFLSLFQNRPALINPKDGSYRVIGLPGPGVLLVHGFDDYLRATERDDEDGTKEANVPAEPYWGLAVNYHAVARVDPPKDADQTTRDVTLDPGETLTGTVLGADGKPIRGAHAYGLSASRGNVPLESADFTIQGYNRHRPRFIFFVHPQKKLAGVLSPPKNKTDPVAVTMQPGALAMGRLINEDGSPRRGATFRVTFRQPSSDHWIAHLPHEITTDQDGRFRLDTLLPGSRVELRDSKGSYEFDAGTTPGDTKDLGDVQAKRNGE
jgi:RNA polymerase sigma factor (sigma-70 family)